MENGINAEASRTAATSASGTPAADFALAALGLRLYAPIRDQLVNQALPGGYVSKQPAETLGRCASPINLAISELGGLSHVWRVAAITAIH